MRTNRSEYIAHADMRANRAVVPSRVRYAKPAPAKHNNVRTAAMLCAMAMLCVACSSFIGV